MSEEGRSDTKCFPPYVDKEDRHSPVHARLEKAKIFTISR